jgi:hypothetical protein
MGGGADKARGKALGNRNLASVRAESNRAVKEAADRHAALVPPHILPLRERGLSLRAIAAELTRLGVPTPRGGQWFAVQVSDAAWTKARFWRAKAGFWPNEAGRAAKIGAFIGRP